MANMLPFDQQAYHLYMDDMNNSQGFYITPSEGGSALVAGVRPVTGEYSGDHLQRADYAATFALDEHNKTAGTKGFLRFKRILNLNRQPTVTAIYYITMEVADVSHEPMYYEAKVWEKLNSGYKVLIFRRAPYFLKSSDKSKENVCCVGINGLLPWMNESYLYYKCFYKVRSELLGVDVLRDEKSGVYKGVLWFKSCGESAKSLMEYVGEKMPCSNKFYDFDLKTCHRNCVA